MSREGLVLIKSFEGFTPRATRRPDGTWVIGYGHTRSAREGLSVSEADAELLLQYDLLPVVAALHDHVRVDLNQHQFDALASFALSVGVDAFADSDVLSVLNGQGPQAAARTLGERGDVDPALARPGRRRAVERALFEADPSGPVALAQLLAAPVAAEAEVSQASAPPPLAADEPHTPEPEREPPAALQVRYAAISQLLGEADEAEPIVRSPDAANEDTPLQPDAAQPADPVAEDAVEATPAAGPAAPSTEAQSTAEDSAQPATASEPEAASEPEDETPAPEPVIQPPAEDPARSAAMAEMVRRQFSPFPGMMYGSLPLGAAKPAPAAEPPPPPAAPAPASEPAPPPPIETPRFAAPDALVLTPAEPEPAALPGRPAWTAEERAEARDDAPLSVDLFTEEELAADTSLGPVMRHEDLEDPRPGVEVGEIGAYVGMGAVGLISLGAAVPAFQVLLNQGAGPSGETLLIFAALVLLGAGCSGIAAYNLMRLWRRHHHRDA